VDLNIIKKKQRELEELQGIYTEAFNKVCDLWDETPDMLNDEQAKEIEMAQNELEQASNTYLEKASEIQVLIDKEIEAAISQY